ncbi:MAG: ferrochelatase, partial [Planctomycetota bacterium]
MATPCDAVLMIAYGGPESMAEVRPFLANILRGKRVPPQRIEEVVDHYGVIGGRSPLNDLIRDQAGRLQTALADAGLLLPVYVGMRNWTPFLADTLGEMAQAGRRRAV